MRTAIEDDMEQLCEQLLTVVWSSYWRWYGAAIEGGMEQLLKQLWRVVWSSYWSSYWRLYEAAIENDIKQLLKQLWKMIWSSYEKRTKDRIFEKFNEETIQSIDFNIINKLLAFYRYRKPSILPIWEEGAFSPFDKVIFWFFRLDSEIPKNANPFANDYISDQLIRVPALHGDSKIPVFATDFNVSSGKWKLCGEKIYNVMYALFSRYAVFWSPPPFFASSLSSAATTSILMLFKNFLLVESW